jgi:hypothetical protein
MWNDRDSESEESKPLTNQHNPRQHPSLIPDRKGTINGVDSSHFNESGSRHGSRGISFDLFRSFSKPGSHLGSLFTIIISTIGGTILYMPSAFLASGLVWSCVLIILCAVLGFFSCSMLVKFMEFTILNSYTISFFKVHASEHSGSFSYPSLAEASYGKTFKTYVKICFILYNWGMIVTYMLLVRFP